LENGKKLPHTVSGQGSSAVLEPCLGPTPMHASAPVLASTSVPASTPGSTLQLEFEVIWFQVSRFQSSNSPAVRPGTLILSLSHSPHQPCIVQTETFFSPLLNSWVQLPPVSLSTTPLPSRRECVQLGKHNTEK
jgi:hypothetical protein